MKQGPVDQAERERATTTFDQNIIVTAGAGTGKTTLLVNRLIHLMIRSPDPIQITEIVALTFTNKASNEMKGRLREALEGLRQAPSDSEVLAELCQRYRLSVREIRGLSEAAIQHLERSEIGTIHHFATSLLRLYPLESGVDPQFRLDEGERISKGLFDSLWISWLEEELAQTAPRKILWKTLLARISLSEIRELVLALSGESIELKSLLAQLARREMAEPIHTWLKALEVSAEALLYEHPESRNVEKMLAASLKIFRKMLETESTQHVLPDVLLGGLSEAEQGLMHSDKKPGKVKGWEADELKEAERLVSIARLMLQIDVTVMKDLVNLLCPFIERFKKERHRRGLISFDGLLIKARNLLRDHRRVREQIKRKCRAILIDEFQDTDPVQYEILLFLSEVDGESAADWRAVNLSSGKLFVVGDPKQSIYGFRRADIAACQLVRALILHQGGTECLLTTNFRSHAGILEPVNGLFQGLIQAESGRQPEYIAIHPMDQDRAPEQNPFRQLVFRSVQNVHEKDTAVSNLTGGASFSRRLEGEAIASWLSETVIEKAMIKGKDGKDRLVRKADVAILMRSLTGVHFYLEPLRRWGMDYVVEGEKRFYQSQEVIDAVNLFRVISDPNDALALVALLRSPLGALNDAEIYELHRMKRLSYLSSGGGLTGLDSHTLALYRLLEALHQEVSILPLAEAVSHIFERTPLVILAAGGIHGEQALANLEKIRQMAENMELYGPATFKEFVSGLSLAIAEEREESESPLSEEGVDAIQVYSVHKAKGLEFPVVVLAGCHAGTRGHTRDRIGLLQDWSSGLSGMFVGDFRDLNSIYLDEKEHQRAIAEEKRVLYVAMTRAREHLMLSAAKRDRRASGCFLSMLESGLGEQLPSEDLPKQLAGITIDSVVCDPDRVYQRPLEKKKAPQIDWQHYANLWQKKKTRYEEILKQPSFITPTFLKNIDEKSAVRRPFSATGKRTHGGEKSLLIGGLAHHFLETWDFSCPIKDYPPALSRFVSSQEEKLIEFSKAEITEELEEIFQVFFHSSVYEEICQSTIVGREMPFLLPWEGQVMEGVIDLVYEKSGLLYIGEYKTDRVQKEDLGKAAVAYHHQALIYPEAVRRALKRDVESLCLIFLRIGEAVAMDAELNHGQ